MWYSKVSWNLYYWFFDTFLQCSCSLYWCVGQRSGEGNCLKKIFEKIHICLHFNIKNSPIYDNLHKVRKAMDCLNKKLCQIRSVTDLPQTNRFVQHMSDIILKYTWTISLTSLCMNCCVVIWALVTGLKFTVGRRMITNSGQLRSLIWEQVAALYSDYTEIEHNLKIRYYITIDITKHWFLLCICLNRKFRFPTGQNSKNKPHGFSEEYARHFDSVNVSAVIFKYKQQSWSHFYVCWWTAQITNVAI